MLSEFDIIKKYFRQQKVQRNDVLLGSGDDAAIVRCPADQDLVISTDTLVENIHFPKNIPAADLGYRALAVNLSDLAAMGAVPAWVLFSLTLEKVSEPWIAKLAEGFFELAEQHQMSLIGGNLSHGPMSLTLQIAGFVPKDKGLKQSTAQVGDLIYVTGEFGRAAVGLKALQQGITAGEGFTRYFLRPEAKVVEGLKLLDIANSCIDISDGLLADLQHILNHSKVGASIAVDKVPVIGELSLDEALNAGEDYQLCFTLPADKVRLLDFECHCIGKIEAETGLRLLKNGKPYQVQTEGYRHF